MDVALWPLAFEVDRSPAAAEGPPRGSESKPVRLLLLDRNPVFPDVDLDAISLLPLTVQLIAHGRSRDDEEADNQVESVAAHDFVALIDVSINRRGSLPLARVGGLARDAAAAARVSIRPAARVL